MSLRKITTIGNPILRTKTQKVDPQELQTDDFSTLIDDMIQTMMTKDGVGLAAPQIGVSKRIFVAATSQGPVALINPEITYYSKKRTKMEEGCLSIPGVFDDVLRSREIKVKALTVQGEPLEFKAKDFFARVVQHETDHLEGILFVDRIEEQKKK